MLLYLVVGLIMFSVIALVWGLASMAPARSRSISRRLSELQAEGGDRFAIQHAMQRRRRQEKREKMQGILESFGERVARREIDWGKTQTMLIQAGYRGSGTLPIYFGVRIVAAMTLAAGALLTGTVSGAGPSTMIAVGVAGLIGWVIPSMTVKRKIRKRQKSIQLALADTLDLLVVCVEAGLGLNQALLRVSDEIEYVSKIMSEELMVLNFEIRAGTPRDEAMRNLGDRTGVPDLKSLTAMLIQTDRFGTSIAKALRVHSDTLRIKRRQRAEEAAAKTTIKLVFPLVLFIFPAMFVVILGPAIIHITEQMKGLM